MIDFISFWHTDNMVENVYLKPTNRHDKIFLHELFERLVLFADLQHNKIIFFIVYKVQIIRILCNRTTRYYKVN